MSVTLETSQEERGWLKESARLNISLMSVTLDTSQEERGWLKDSAYQNILFMSVTLETSQEERLPLKWRVTANMPDMSETRLRSGASVARYTMLRAPSKASLMLVQYMSPHCSMEASLSSGEDGLSRWNLSRPPDIEMVWVPFSAYVWVRRQYVSRWTVPSPQSMLQTWPVPGMVIDWLAESVFQVVINGLTVGSFTVISKVPVWLSVLGSPSMAAVVMANG